jgi:hypothetical protein
VGEKQSLYTEGEKEISAVAMEISMVVPQKTKSDYDVMLLYHSWGYT